MRALLFTFCIIVISVSCNSKNSGRSDQLIESKSSSKVFYALKKENYMIHSEYSNESVRWDKLVASYNSANNKIANSSFVINFSTENFLNTKKIDSAFVQLTPFFDENLGENEMIIRLINDKFYQNFNWDNKPVLDNSIYSKSKMIESKNEKAINIDVTNLVKMQIKKMQFNLPLHFSLYNSNGFNIAFACFHSTNGDVKEVYPLLKVYYH